MSFKFVNLTRYVTFLLLSGTVIPVVLTVYIEHATPLFLPSELDSLDSTALRLLAIPEFQEY